MLSGILLLLLKLHIILIYFYRPIVFRFHGPQGCRVPSPTCSGFGRWFSFIPCFPHQILTFRCLPLLILFKYYNCSEAIVLLGVSITLTIILMKCTFHSALTCIILMKCTFHSAFTCTTYCSLRKECTITKQPLNYTCASSL